MWPGTIGEFSIATGQTLLMVGVSTALAMLLGIPLGVWLYATASGRFSAAPHMRRVLDGVVNVVRSIPFIILMVLMIPVTQCLVGSSIGTWAAIVPLSVSAIPFLGRIVESALSEVAEGLIEAGHAMGATPLQIVVHVLWPEALPAIVRGITLTAVALVGYSAMAGVVGGGGLGDLAIRYGYQRFEIDVMVATVVLLVVLVQLLQWIGDCIAKRLAH